MLGLNRENQLVELDEILHAFVIGDAIGDGEGFGVDGLGNVRRDRGL